MLNNLPWVFFGTNTFSVITLDELKAKGYLPRFIVTVEDKPKGRKLILTPREVKLWAEKESIPYIQPRNLKDSEVAKEIKKYSPELFVVSSFGKIIPHSILEIPEYRALNIHPSLLPKLRGASPIESAIIEENETGVTIIRLDEQMDHGPIVGQKNVTFDEWPPYAEDLEETLAHEGGKLLAEIIPQWIEGKIEEKAQDDSQATFCKKIEKEDALIYLSESPEINLRKVRAYHIWPKAYLLKKQGNKDVRIIVKTAHVDEGKFIIDTVIPEGKKEMSYSDYLRGNKAD